MLFGPPAGAPDGRGEEILGDDKGAATKLSEANNARPTRRRSVYPNGH
jgi:hypothetical protein